MKKIAIWAIAMIAVAVTGCKSDGKSSDGSAENAELRGDLQETLAAQDSLLALVNDISEGMNQIKDLEKIMSIPGSLDGESVSRKEQIKNDMLVIQQALEQRRERLNQLEQKLATTQGQNGTLQRTIKTLKAQIAAQETEIATLTNELAQAHIQIDELGHTVNTLNTQVDSLNVGVATARQETRAAEEKTRQATNELNMCYYAVGSKSELKKHNILTGGGLFSKAKLTKGDFDQSYFTTADKRTLTLIPTHSKKAKVLTDQPENSYTIADENGQKVIHITHPERFWQKGNYLVIQVD